MTLGLINANPVVQAKKERLVRAQDQYRDDDDDGVDPLEIYDILFLFEFGLIHFFCCGFLLFLDIFGIFDESGQSM